MGSHAKSGPVDEPRPRPASGIDPEPWAQKPPEPSQWLPTPPPAQEAGPKSKPSKPKKSPEQEKKDAKQGGIILLVLALIVGAFFLGGGVMGHTTVKTHTVTKTVSVPTTPDDCLDALDQADTALKTGAKMLTAVGQLGTDMSADDYASAISDATRVSDLGTTYGDDVTDYVAARNKCRTTTNAE